LVDFDCGDFIHDYTGHIVVFFKPRRSSRPTRFENVKIHSQ
jgi:hypothetical protein